MIKLMKNWLTRCLLASLCVLVLQETAYCQIVLSDPPVCRTETFFSPETSIKKQVLGELHKAKKSVHASLYVLSNNELIMELISLSKKGIDVRVALDKHFLNTDRGKNILALLIRNDIPVYIKKQNDLNHTKFAIIDDKTVITGSWNWSNSADKQDNDLLIIDCDTTTMLYIAKFNMIRRRDQL